MYSLPTRNKEILIRKIQHYKKVCFPGKGSSVRLADEIGVPQQTVSDWLDGSRTPTIEQLYRLAKTFNVSPLKLYGIRGKGRSTRRSTADISLLRSLLDMLEYAMRHDVSPVMLVKAMASINDILIKEIQEIEDDGNDNLI